MRAAIRSVAGIGPRVGRGSGQLAGLGAGQVRGRPAGVLSTQCSTWIVIAGAAAGRVVVRIQVGNASGWALDLGRGGQPDLAGGERGLRARPVGAAAAGQPQAAGQQLVAGPRQRLVVGQVEELTRREPVRVRRRGEAGLVA